MKFAVLALSIALTAGAAAAQTTPVPAPAPAPAPAATAKFNLDTPIETIVADPAGKAVLDAEIPQLTTHASYDMFKTMSLRQLEPMSQGALTTDVLTKTEKALAGVK